MSVLIKGMKMPKSCSECGFECRAYCFLVDTVIESNDRPDWCPLVEVPTPHGKLKDGDSLIELCGIMADKCDGIGVSIWEQLAEVVRMSPIIIEAEEE